MLRKDRAFTLIEVLVAVALTAILLTALYGTFFTVVRGVNGAEGGLDGYIEAGKLLDRISIDAHSAYFKAQSGSTVFKGERKGENSSLTFTAFSFPPGGAGPASDLVRVSYFAEKDGGAYKVFKETSNPYTGESFKAEMTGEVKGFEVSYFNGKDWAKAWDSSLEMAMPKAIKATVKLKDGAEVSAIAQTFIR